MKDEKVEAQKARYERILKAATVMSDASSRQPQEMNILTSVEAGLLNDESVRRAQEFTFG